MATLTASPLNHSPPHPPRSPSRSASRPPHHSPGSRSPTRSPSRRPLAPIQPASSSRPSAAYSAPIASTSKLEPATRPVLTGSERKAAAGPAGCRLLWRGRLVVEGGRALNGLAIVAHLFAVPSAPGPNEASPALARIAAAAAQPSPFDDPFSPFAASAAASTDLCLGLEMLRGADISLLPSSPLDAPPLRVRRAPPPDSLASSPAAGSLYKLDSGEVEVETPTDVRLYVDGRCVETVYWMEETFCRAGAEGRGVRLEVGGEEFILFAQAPALDFSVSGSERGRPELALLLGRAVRRKVRKPRPDDPMPRENLFANKLRRTSSLPVLSFDQPATSATSLGRAKPPTRTSSLGTLGRPKLPRLKERTPGSRALLGMLEEEAETGAAITSAALPSTRSQNKGKGKGRGSEALAPRTLQRSLSTMSGRSEGGRASMFSTASAVDSLAAAAAKRQAGASRKRKAPSQAVGDSDEDDESWVPGSPILSVATMLNGFGGDDEDDGANRLHSRRRSSSLAVPAKQSGRASRAGSVGASSRGRSREPSVAPADPDSVEGRNKNAVRKAVLARLTARGVGREDDRFAAVFAVTSKGVQFALREGWKMSPVDRALATSLTDRHIDMYLPESAGGSAAALSGPDVGKVKEEEDGEAEGGLLPSPKSLEVGETQVGVDFGE